MSKRRKEMKLPRAPIARATVAFVPRPDRKAKHKVDYLREARDVMDEDWSEDVGLDDLDDRDYDYEYWDDDWEDV